MKYLLPLLFLVGCGCIPSRCPEMTYKYAYGQKAIVTEGFWAGQSVTIKEPSRRYNPDGCNFTAYLVSLDSDPTQTINFPEHGLAIKEPLPLPQGADKELDICVYLVALCASDKVVNRSRCLDKAMANPECKGFK